jgi:hypothetical protein
MIESNKEGKHYSCKFLLEMPFKPLLLDGLMSSSDGFPYAYDKKDDYISPIQI